MKKSYLRALVKAQKVCYHSTRQTNQNKNALKRNSKFLNASREQLVGVKLQPKGIELVSKQLAELIVGGAGAWPLADRRVSMLVEAIRTCREHTLLYEIRVVTREYISRLLGDGRFFILI